MPVLSFSTPREFSWNECLRYLGRSAHESLHVAEDGTLKKVIRRDTTNVFLTVRLASSGLFEVDYQADQNTPELHAFVRDYTTEWLDLDTDLYPFYALAERDALLAPAIRQHYGLRLITIPDLFEALCWAIIGQQINLTFAYAGCISSTGCRVAQRHQAVARSTSEARPAHGSSVRGSMAGLARLCYFLFVADVASKCITFLL